MRPTFLLSCFDNFATKIGVDLGKLGLFEGKVGIKVPHNQTPRAMFELMYIVQRECIKITRYFSETFLIVIVASLKNAWSAFKKINCFHPAYLPVNYLRKLRLIFEQMILRFNSDIYKL